MAAPIATLIAEWDRFDGSRGGAETRRGCVLREAAHFISAATSRIGEGRNELGGQILSASPRLRVNQILGAPGANISRTHRSEEHTSELQSLMRISYAVFCLKKTNNIEQTATKHTF